MGSGLEDIKQLLFTYLLFKIGKSRCQVLCRVDRLLT